MLSLTRKTDYALVALAGLAALGASADSPVSASRLAQAYALPLPMLMNVLKVLHRGELVAAARGASGGYYLQRDPAWISVMEVIEVVEGPIRLAPCCEADADDAAQEGADGCTCATHPTCPITRAIRGLHQRIHDMLRRLTIRDLLNEGEADAQARPGVTLTVHADSAAAP